jgi:hypothetical protein
VGGVIECVGCCCVDGDGAGIGFGVRFMAGGGMMLASTVFFSFLLQLN